MPSGTRRASLFALPKDSSRELTFSSTMRDTSRSKADLSVSSNQIGLANTSKRRRPSFPRVTATRYWGSCILYWRSLHCWVK